MRGSATALRWRDECLLFLCRHQFKDYQPDDVVIPLDNSGKTLISGSSLKWQTETAENRDEEFLDVNAMTFVPANYGPTNLEHGFLSVMEADCWNGRTDANFMLFGYPTALRMVDYETPHIHTRQIVTSAIFSQGTSARGVFRIEMTRTENFSSDGLSGGPVFHLGKDRRGFFIGLAGLVMRGSDTSNFLHVMDSRYLLKFFSAQLAAESA
jgi:hypothetical protein